MVWLPRFLWSNGFIFYNFVTFGTSLEEFLSKYTKIKKAIGIQGVWELLVNFERIGLTFLHRIKI